MSDLQTQTIKVEVGAVALVVSHENVGEDNEKVLYQVYDNTTDDPGNVIPAIVRGLCHIAATNPDLIFEAYKEALVAEVDEPDWATDVEGNA